MLKLMKFTMTAGACALLLASCGGSDGPVATVTPPPAAPVLTLSGTAATGLALASSPVSVKCATGAGSTTTAADGTYSINLEGAVLPCIVQVTGTVGEATITLHSVAEAGTQSGTNTAAVANVTPLSEMVLAQATGTLPADLFTTGVTSTTAQQLTTTQLNTAINAIITALKDVVDLSSIGDPLKAPLTAATAANKDAGNPFDKLLDSLGTKLSVEALPQIVNQIAAAQTSPDPTAGLKDVVATVSAGSLAGCPSAVGGKYRMLAYYGDTVVRQFDFAAGTMTNRAGEPVYTITASPTKPCTFLAERRVNNIVEDDFEFAIGPAGAGVYRGRRFEPGTTNLVGQGVGYVFPVQALPYSVMTGEWNSLESGWFGSSFRHELGKMTFTADRKISYCEYKGSPLTCVADEDSGVPYAIQDRADGGFDIVEGGETIEQVFPYRTPAGAIALFGTLNPTGAITSGIPQTHYVAGKLKALTLPAVGATSRFYEFGFSRASNGSGGTFNRTEPLTIGENTVISVNATANSLVRRNQAGREDTNLLNDPVAGFRFRPAGTFTAPSGTVFNFSDTVTIGWPGLGLGAAFNAQPSASNGAGHFFFLSINRP